MEKKKPKTLRLLCWKSVYLPFRHIEKEEVANIYSDTYILQAS